MLVFVQTKERAKELFKELIYDNIMVDAIHADRTQLQVCELMRVLISLTDGYFKPLFMAWENCCK